MNEIKNKGEGGFVSLEMLLTLLNFSFVGLLALPLMSQMNLALHVSLMVTISTFGLTGYLVSKLFQIKKLRTYFIGLLLLLLLFSCVVIQDKVIQPIQAATEALPKIKASLPPVVIEEEVLPPLVEEIQITEAQQQEIDRWIKELKNEDWKVRYDAVEVLVGMGVITVPTLIESLNDESSSVRNSAAKALGKLGVKNEEVIAALFNRLKNDESSSVRGYAAKVLGKLGVKNEEVIAVLRNRLKNDESSSVRGSVASALGKLGVKNEEVIAALLDRLKNDRDSDVRSSATEALGELSVKNEEVIAVLLNRLKNDESSSVRYYTVKALGKLGVKNEEIIAALLLNRLKNEEGWTKDVAEALVNLGVSHKESTSIVLLDRLKNDRDSDVRKSATKALGKLGVKSEKVTIALIDRLKNDRASDVRSYAALALGKLGVSSQSVIAALLDCVKNDRAVWVRIEAVKALDKLGVRNQEVIAALLKIVKNYEDGDVRIVAVKILGTIGSEAKAAEPVLEEIIADTGFLIFTDGASPRLRQAAKEALEKIKKAIATKLELETEKKPESSWWQELNISGYWQAQWQELKESAISLKDNLVEIIVTYQTIIIGSGLAITSIFLLVYFRNILLVALQKVFEGSEWFLIQIVFTVSRLIVSFFQLTTYLKIKFLSLARFIFRIFGIYLLISFARKLLDKLKNWQQKRVLKRQAILEIKQFIEQVKSKDQAIKTTSAQKLIDLGPKVIPHVARLLKSRDDSVRYMAIEILMNLGISSEVYLATLADLLFSSNEAIKTSAANKIKEMGREAQPIIPQLILALDQTPPTINDVVLEILKNENIGIADKSALKSLINIAKKTNHSKLQHQTAIRTLGNMGNEAKTAKKALNKIVEDENADSKLRREAHTAVNRINRSAINLSPIGKSAKDPKKLTWQRSEEMKKLRKLKNAELEQRILIVQELGQIGDLSEKTMQEIIKFLTPRNEAYKYQKGAMDVLLENEEIKRYTLDLLVIGIRIVVFFIGILPYIETEQVKQKITVGLLKLILWFPFDTKPKIVGRLLIDLGEGSVESLRKGLKSNNHLYQKKVIFILGEMQEKAQPAIPDLIQALKIEESGVNWEARLALVKIGASVVEKVADVLVSDASTSQEKILAASILRNLKDKSRTVTPELKQALADENREVRRQVALTFKNLGVEAIVVKPELVARLLNEQEDVSVRAAALEALKTMREKIEEIDELLNTLPSADKKRQILQLVDLDETIRLKIESANTLSRAGPNAERVLLKLIEVLKTSEWQVRVAVVDSLGELGYHAAIPALKRSLQDKDERVQVAAQVALAKI